MKDIKELESKKHTLQRELTDVQRQIAEIANESNKSLEEKFNNTFENVTKDINRCITAAKNNIQEAVELSELHGIPFSSNLSPFASRTYFPKSFSKIWPSPEILELAREDFGTSDQGWEYWSSSSLSC